MTTFSKKTIKTTITLVNDKFEDGSNRIVAEGLRTLCTVQFGGGNIMPTAEIVIYGLNMAAMLKLTRIRWQDINSMQNVVKIEADGHVVYEGNITFGYIDMSNAPDVAFRIRSVTAIYHAFNPVAESMFLEIPVVDAIENIARDMGYLFENNEVSRDLMLREVTLKDTALNKIRKLCRDYQIDLYIENNTISIARQGFPRKLAIPLISPRSGLIGYPVPTMQGVDFKCFFDPEVRFGGLIRIADSLMTSTNGDWRVFGVTISLESEIPGGNWFMDVRATFNEPNNVAISK